MQLELVGAVRDWRCAIMVGVEKPAAGERVDELPAE